MKSLEGRSVGEVRVGIQASGARGRLLKGGAQSPGSWTRVHTQPCRRSYDGVSERQGFHLGTERMRSFPRQGWGVSP